MIVDAASYGPEPTPGQIITSMRKATMLGQEQFVAETLGRPVRWELRFFGATIELEQRPFEADVQATVRSAWSHMVVSVFTFLDLREYPEVKTARPGQRIVLYGRIAELDTLNIRLKTDRIELLSPRFWDTWNNM